MGQKNGLYAFGYNSAKSNPIWTKFEKLWAKCWELVLADLERDVRSSDSLRSSRFFCAVNNKTSPIFREKHFTTFEHNNVNRCRHVKFRNESFDNFTISGRISQTTQKLLKKFPDLATSDRHNSQMITNSENSRPNGFPAGCPGYLVSIFTVSISSKSSPGLYAAHRKATPNFFAIFVTAYGNDNAYICHKHAAN